MGDPMLVTGATGTVGRHVLGELIDRGFAPRIGVRDAASLEDRAEGTVAAALERDCSVVEFDFGRPETWGEALSGADGLYLLYPPGVPVSEITEFVDAAVRTGCSHIVFLSVLGAETVPVIPHRRIERHLAAAPVASTIIRASYFMQNLVEIHRPEILTRNEIFVPAGDGRVGFVDARDVGAVAATALLEPHPSDRVHTVTGSESIGFSTVAEALSHALDRPIRYADPSIPVFAWRMHRRGIEPGLILFMIAEYTVMRLGLSSRTTSEVATVLGREPRSIDQFAEDYRDEFAPQP